jgi:XTP/dITP diphosphohydrolase
MFLQASHVFFYPPPNAPMSPPSTLVLATGNPGKVAELRALLADLSVALVPAADLDAPPEVVEDAGTLAGNAQKKARAFHAHTGQATLADDTGLEVPALGGGPGVHTARFAGPDATPEDNKQRLLDEMDGVEDRRARFRTVVALIEADGTARTFEGLCRGTIPAAPRGSGGFGYDPLFQPEGHDQTFAEMPADAKNEISHRRRALDALHDFLADAA